MLFRKIEDTNERISILKISRLGHSKMFQAGTFQISSTLFLLSGRSIRTFNIKSLAPGDNFDMRFTSKLAFFFLYIDQIYYAGKNWRMQLQNIQIDSKYGTLLTVLIQVQINRQTFINILSGVLVSSLPQVKIGRIYIKVLLRKSLAYFDYIRTIE